MLQNLDVIKQKNLTIFTVLMIILCYQYYDTEDFSSISIIVMLNITIHDNIVILPSPITMTLKIHYNNRYSIMYYCNNEPHHRHKLLN